MCSNTYLRLSLKSNLGQKCPKANFWTIFGFVLVFDGAKWLIKSPHQNPQLKYMLFDARHVIVGQKWAITMVLAIFLGLVCFVLVLDWFKLLIWGFLWLSQLKYMLFDTQHVTVGPKLAKTMVLAISLGLVWVGWFWIGSNDVSEAAMEFPS